MRGYATAIFGLLALCAGSAVALKCHVCSYTKTFIAEAGNECLAPTGTGQDCEMTETFCKTTVTVVSVTNTHNIQRTCAHEAECTEGSASGTIWGLAGTNVTCCQTDGCNTTGSGDKIMLNTAIIAVLTCFSLIGNLA